MVIYKYSYTFTIAEIKTLASSFVALVWWILFLFLWPENDRLLFDVGSVAAVVPEGLSLFGNVRYDSSGRLASALEGLVLSALEDKPFLMVG